MASEARHHVGRAGLGLVFGGFGIWELHAPSQWSGYVPHVLAAHLPVVPLVLAHGWILLMLGMALLIDFLPGIAVWAGVAVMAEVCIGLALSSGWSVTLLRDIGILTLALVTALDASGAGQAAVRPARAGLERTP